MTQPDDPDRLALDSLGPDPGWIDRVAAQAHRAASARTDQGAWRAIARTGRWCLPLAAAIATACWIVPARPAAPSSAGLLLVGSDRDALWVRP